MFRRSSRWGAALAIGFAGLIGAGAVAARTGASTLELVFHARHEAVPVSDSFPLGVRHTGTFTSQAPFCGSGTAVDLRWDAGGTAATRRYTCDDGSGSLTLSVTDLLHEHTAPFTGRWTILDGTSRYSGLRGKGTYRGEILGGTPGDPLTIVFRATSKGFADPMLSRRPSLSRPRRQRSYVALPAPTWSGSCSRYGTTSTGTSSRRP